MTDTASSILLLRLQSTGSNTNLWGGYLNTALQTIERADKGYQALPVTGDATISWTNYSASNDGAVAALKLTGSPAASTLTFPSKQHFLYVWNATSATITIKCSGGTGVTLTTGQRALINCDATDFSNAAPTVFPTADITFSGQLKGVTAGTAATDAVNKTQMETAIATLLAGSVSGLVLNSSTATTPNYLSNVLSVTGALSKTTVNAGTSTEATQLSLSAASTSQAGSMSVNQVKSLDALIGKVTATISGGSTVVATAYNRYKFTGSGTLTLPTFAADEFVIVEFGASAGTTQTVGRNSQTIDGASADDTSTRYGDVVLYRCTTAGAVVTEHIALLPA